MSTVTPDMTRAYMAMLSVSTRIQQTVDQDLRERVSLTHPQSEMLAVLRDFPEGVRMSELAEHLLLSRSGLTYQVTQLEKRGLVARRRDANDDRSVIARLTEAGAALLDEAIPAHTALVERLLFQGLPAGEVAQLADTLEAMSARLTERLTEETGTAPLGGDIGSDRTRAETSRRTA